VSTDPNPKKADSGVNPRMIAMGLLAALGIALAVLNSQSVKTHWILGTSKLPLFLVIAATAAIGAALGYLTALRRGR